MAAGPRARCRDPLPVCDLTRKTCAHSTIKREPAMNNRSRISHLAASGRATRGALAGLTLLLSATLAAQEGGYPGAGGAGVQAAPDATGVIATVDVNGRVNERGAFFQSL